MHSWSMMLDADSLSPNVTQLPNRLLNHCQQRRHKHTRSPNPRLYLHSLSCPLESLSVVSPPQSNSADIRRPCRVRPVSIGSRRSAMFLCEPPAAPSVCVHRWMRHKIATHLHFIFSFVLLCLTDQSIVPPVTLLFCIICVPRFCSVSAFQTIQSGQTCRILNTNKNKSLN